ncbi:phage tail protein, partial [Palleronia sp.]|uniref:phage tail protein n=1 Tax=Palleronia sp. TaxID=1940284 RepID=UPI0035C8592C
NLFSTDVVEAILAVSEGPIKGLADGPKSFYVGDTPLLDPVGKNNFDGFELIAREGGVLGEKITPRMGGFGTSTNVGVELAPQTPVVRAGYQTEIDYIDIRLVVSRLSKDNDDGSFEHTGKVKIEYRKSGVSAWTPVRTPEAEPFPEQEAVTGGAVYRNYGNNPAQIAAAVWDYVSTVANNALAAANAKMGTWFKADENYKPYQWSGEAWTPVEGATRTGKVWTFNGRRVTYSTEPPANRVVGEGWIHTDSNLHKIWNGDAWVKGGSSFEPGGVGSNGTGGKITVDAGEISIFGKTTSAFVKELRIPVENGPHTYEVRVTRTSPANTDELFFDVSWESFQELSVEPMKFPGVATIQLTARASEQFSSIPEFSGVFEGRTVKVPSNYDPKTRKYEGLWDGTWKVDYTNNPAFIGLDLIENNRYGLSAYYPVTVNKFDIYEAGQWCDTKAADGSPRFTFNGVIDTPRDGREAINYVFGLFGGRFFDDGNGTGVIRLDQDSAAVAVFSPENVEGGVFTYAQTPLASRHNDITVTFINPALNWQEDRRRVFDQDNIDTYGRNATSMVAVGCTSVEEAIRRGRYRLVTGLTEKTTVGFTTNRMGAFLQPYDVILVADQDYDFGLHGRVQSIVDANTIQLRDPIYLEPGISYRVSFTVIDTVSDEYTVVTLNIASGQSGNRTTLNLTSSLPGDVLAGSVFTVHQTGTTIAPKPFRVLDIENDADSEKVKISAIEINRAKWPYVDGRIDEIEYNGFYDLKTSQIPEPVTNPRVTVKSQKQGKRVIRTMNFSWDPSPSTFVTKYRLSASANGGPMTQLAEVASLRHEWRDIAPANYVFTVEPIGKNGILGRATTFEHKMLRASEDLDTIGNLTLSNAGTVRPDGVFTPMLVASWDAYTEETISEYQVQWKTSTATKWQNASVEDPSFELPNPVAGETYELRVRAVADATILTKWAKASSVVQVDTLAPPVPTNWRGKANFDAVVLRGDRSPANDFRGFRVYASTATSTVLVFLSEHRGNIITLTPEAADIFTRYKISAIDYAGNESAKTDYIEAAPIVNPATVVPNAPTGLIVTSVVIDQHRSRVKVDWNVSPEVGVVGYKVKVRPATGAATITPAGVTHFEFDWTVNTNVYVSVCAENVMGQLGAYSAEVLHKAIKDSTPPAVPTGLKANPGLKLLALEWGKVADADLKEYEVYVHTAATPAPTTGTTPTFVTGVSAYVVTGLGDEENRWFWVRSVDHAGNKSAWSSSASGKTLAAPGVNQQQLQGMIDRTSFAAGVEPVEVRSTLPGTPHVQGRLVALTTDGKLYRNTGSGWTAAVDAADISGQVAAAQIAALEASKITGQLSAAQIASIEAAKVSGQLTSAQIASIEASKLTGQLVAAQLADAQITAAKLTAGLKAIEIVGTLPGAPHPQGRSVLLTTDNKLYRNTGSGWTAAVAATDMTGQLTDAQIAAVSAAKLAGQLTDAQIAAIDAAKLTGTINEARLASLDASKLTGTINEARIAGLAASKVTGQLSASQIASLEAAKISGQLTDAQIANIAASKMTGQVVAAQIAAAAIDATKLTSGLKAIEIVSTLPGAPHTQGRTVLLTTDNKLYRNTGAGWTAAVAASDMSGQLTSAQVADLDAAKLTGTIVEARL